VRVVVLGSGDAFGSGGRAHSAYLIETPHSTVLLECGPTILQAMKGAGHDTAKIDAVLLSHMHGDHFGGVPFLLMEYLYERPRERPLTVFGPPETEARTRRLFSALYEKPAEKPLSFPLRWHEVAPGTPVDVAGLRTTPFVATHVPELCCYGYRIEVGGKTIVYSGDSAWTDELARQARGADLFLCECSTYETLLPIHIAYPEIAARARELGCRRLVLSHLGAEPLRRLEELKLECARDGMTIEL